MYATCIFAVALGVLCFAVPGMGQGLESNLVLLKEAADAHGAVCLDGTPGGYYWAPAQSEADANNWLIYFQGGGWCYKETDCLERSLGALGSSLTWAPTYVPTGLLSLNASVSPDFAGYNHVMINYCDGASFSGNLEGHMLVNNTKLYMRGRRIVDAVFEDISLNFNFTSAEKVVLNGCSAGGLATYLHADYVSTLLPDTVTQYGAIPGSGYFLDHDSVIGAPVYGDEMAYVTAMQNITNGVNDACINAEGPAELWHCMFAAWTYDHVSVPVFPINSAYDAWSVPCILTSEPVPVNSSVNGVCGTAPGYDTCAWNITSCTPPQMDVYNEWRDFFVANFTSSPAFDAQGNGAFIHSCFQHCEYLSDEYWLGFTINGTSMQQAVTNWWNSDFADPAADHTYLPCTRPDTAPYVCNPTCVDNMFSAP